jgi:hypothetical protein
VNFRFGSLADIVQRPRHVRFTPNSGHSSVQLECPKSAKSRHAFGSPELKPMGVVLGRPDVAQEQQCPLMASPSKKNLVQPVELIPPHSSSQ